MAQPTGVNRSKTALNSQVTDSISQVNAEVVGLAPASASGNYFQGNSQAFSLAALNATQAQQQNCINMNASTPVAINTLYAIDTSTGNTGDTGIFDEVPKLKTKRMARVKLMRR
jgi:hypothetical protein